MADLNIALIISASDQASGKMKTVGNSAENMGKKVKSSVGPEIAAAAAAGIALAATYVAQFVSSSLEEFQAFETGMSEVFTLVPGMSEEAMGAMEAQALDASAAMGVLPEETIPALYQALSAGVPSDNVFSFLETANQAAIGGVTDLETAVDSISSVTNAYGEELIGATEASDLMFTAVRLGKTTFDELGSSLFQVVPTAASLGVGFGDITAALAVMTAQGVPTSVATTQLRQALVELSKEGSAAAATFERAAGVSFAQFIAQGGNLQQALAIMEQAAGSANVPVSNLFGSVEAGNAVLALTGNNTDTFINALDEMADSAGATDAAAGQFEGTMGRLEDVVAAQTSQLKILIADGLAPTKKAWLELKTIILEAAIASAKDAQTRRENFQTWEEERDIQGDVIAQLNDYIATNEVAISTSDGYADAQEGVWEALDRINAQFDPYNGSLEDSENNTRAVAAALELLQGGFEGTGEELAAAALKAVEFDDALQAMRGTTIATVPVMDGHVNALIHTTEATAAADAASAAYYETTRLGDDALSLLIGDVEAATVVYEGMITTQEDLAAHQALINQYWGESGTVMEPLFAAYEQASLATGQLIEVDGQWMTDHDAAALAIQAANSAIGQSYREMAAEAIFAEQGVNESTIAMAVSLGLLTPEAAAARLEFANTSAIIMESLVPAFNAGKLSGDELEIAIGLLEEGTVNSAEAAIAMATAANSQMTPALRDAKEEAIALETPLRTIKEAAEDAAGNYSINFDITQTGSVPNVNGGYSGSSGAGNVAPDDSFAFGGYTGDGGTNEIAGFVHKREFVIPADVVDAVGLGNLQGMFGGGYQTPGPVQVGPVRSTADGDTARPQVVIDMRGSTFNGEVDVEKAVERAMRRYGQSADVAVRTR